MSYFAMKKKLVRADKLLQNWLKVKTLIDVN